MTGPGRPPIHPKNPTELAQRIMEACRFANLSPTAVEKKAGLSSGHMSKLLSGERGERIGGDTAQKIADVTRVNVNWLISGKGPLDRSFVREKPDMHSSADVTERTTVATLGGHPGLLPNLDACIAHYGGAPPWSPWTIAAARAGYLGLEDESAPIHWVARLDALEAEMAQRQGHFAKGVKRAKDRRDHRPV